RGLLPGIVWFPFATVIGDLSLPPPPHAASRHARRSPLLSFFVEPSHDGTYGQTQTSLLASSRRPASSGPGPPPSPPPTQDPGQGQERSPSAAGGCPGRSAARATPARRRHRHRFTLPLGLCRLRHRSWFLLDSRVPCPYGWPEGHCGLPA